MHRTPRFASLLLAAALFAVAGTAQSETQLALRFGTFDPLLDAPSVPEMLRDGQSPSLWIVQFHGKPTEELRQKIAVCGGAVKGYLPHRAHVVRMDSVTAKNVRAIDGVRWVGSYQPAFRIDPALLSKDGLDLAAPAALFNVVVLDKRTDKPALIRAFEAMRARVTNEQPGSLLLEVELTGAQLLQALRLDQVLWIDLVTETGRDMDKARVQLGADHIETLGGYSGQGVRGHIYEGIQFDHPDFTTQPLAVLSCNTADDHGHATAGIVFGNGTSSIAARGMAPSITPFFTNYSCVPIGVSRWQVVETLVNTHEVMFTTASWGSGLSASYTSITADADDIVFDHGIAWTQSQSNNGNQQSRPQAWAKNVFSVGGVRHFDNANPADDSWSGGASIGPAADGRLKPDFCSYYDSIHTSDRTGGAGYDVGDSYTNFGGTSGATPIVAGSNALAIQMFTDGLFGPVRVPGGTRFQNRPNFTTLKALQIASASPYAFTAASTDNRREHQGWGQPSLKAMYDDRALMFVVDEGGDDVCRSGRQSLRGPFARQRSDAARARTQRCGLLGQSGPSGWQRVADRWGSGRNRHRRMCVRAEPAGRAVEHRRGCRPRRHRHARCDSFGRCRFRPRRPRRHVRRAGAAGHRDRLRQRLPGLDAGCASGLCFGQ